MRILALILGLLLSSHAFADSAACVVDGKGFSFGLRYGGTQLKWIELYEELQVGGQSIHEGEYRDQQNIDGLTISAEVGEGEEQAVLTVVGDGVEYSEVGTCYGDPLPAKFD